MSICNEHFGNHRTENEIQFDDESIADTSSVYVEERYSEVVTRKFRGGKSWMVGYETFYTTNRTENPDKENGNKYRQGSKWRPANTVKEVAKGGNLRSYKQDCNAADLPTRPKVNGGARSDVFDVKWNEPAVRVDEKNRVEETATKELVKNENAIESRINNSRSLIADNKTDNPYRSDDESLNGTMMSCANKKCSKSVKNGDINFEKSFVNSLRQRRRRSSGPDIVTPIEGGDVFESEKRRSRASRRNQSRDRMKPRGPPNEAFKSREDPDGDYNMNKKIYVENWLKHSTRFNTHDQFKSDIACIDFIEVNRLAFTDFERGSLSTRNISDLGSHSMFSNGCQNLCSNMLPFRDASFWEGQSGSGYSARVYSDNNNEDFFLCASVFLFGHANRNLELRQEIELFSHRLHIRYESDYADPVTPEERQVLSFASKYNIKVEALVRVSADKYYWMTFDPPGESRPTQTMHLYYYARNYCDLIMKRDELCPDCA